MSELVTERRFEQDICVSVDKAVRQMIRDELSPVNFAINVDVKRDATPGFGIRCAASFDIAGERRAVLSWIETPEWRDRGRREQWLHELASTMRAAIALYQGEAEASGA